jgi:hypothetical protein
MQDCHVHAIARDYGALTAQNRQSMLEDTGFSFVNCRVTGSGALYLGRAWGTFSRVVFAYTYMDNIIIPNGWYNWGDPNRELYVPVPPSSPLRSCSPSISILCSRDRRGNISRMQQQHAIALLPSGTRRARWRATPCYETFGALPVSSNGLHAFYCFFCARIDELSAVACTVGS